MRPFAERIGTLALVWAAASAFATEPVTERDADARTLVGQVLLPPGEGSRGVEVIVTVALPERTTSEK